MSFFSVGSPLASWSRGASLVRRRRQDSHDDDNDCSENFNYDDDDDNNNLDGDVPNPDGLYFTRTAPRKPSLVDLGGVNSIRSFTRSWQRAAGFPEAIPQPPPIVLIHDDDHHNHHQDSREQDGQNQLDVHNERDELENGLGGGDMRRILSWELGDSSRPGSFSEGGSSLLRRHLEEARRSTARASLDNGLSNSAIDIGDEEEAIDSPLFPSSNFRDRERKAAYDAELGASPPQQTPFFSSVTSPLIGSYSSRHGHGYGTLSDPHSPGRPIELVYDASTSLLPPDAHPSSREPILLHGGVTHNGKIVVLAVEGRSTLPQTVFNSSNALIGVGLLSLPLAFHYSGWVFGLLMLSACAAVTAHTSRLLAKCMRPHPAVLSFADLAYVCFGARARLLTSAVFSAELIAASVALLVLFADSLDLLFPGVLSLSCWKLVCAAVLFPLHFLPMRLLGYTSAIGILATFSVVAIVVVDGLIKQDAPGSLVSPLGTHLFPENWRAVPLAYGLFLSPFAAHSVLPNIYRDMRHPHKFAKAVTITFSFTFLVDLAMAVVGILMFGDSVREEITSNILGESSSAYPRALTYAMCVLIAIVPLTKVPLNSRPLVTSTELALGIFPSPGGDDSDDDSHGHGHRKARAFWTTALRALVRAAILLLVVAISILFPAFDSILSLMGSLFCALISVILPISFHLKMFDKEISPRERLVSCLIIGLFGIGSVIGTVFTIIPKSALGIES